MIRILTCILFFFSLTCPALAQLKSPSEFLGYELGMVFTPHHRVTDYIRHVAEASDRAVRVEYGHTYEGRVLQYLILSSADNLVKLEDIRTANLQRAQLLEGDISEDIPVLVWLSYNVHGNESVSTEAALKVIYTLAGDEDGEVQEWRQNAVIIVDPCLNPDGRDRYVHFYRQVKGRKVNIAPEAREHSEPWPGGRTNHYYFDLNRDWAWGTQLETRQRLLHYNRWMPHIHVDFHEQGINSPYYFAPAAVPYHRHITPWQRELQNLMGANHAHYFDAKGWLFFTRQIFDLLYPGYGDTWPTFNGAVGMTYEQAGSGRAGLGVLTSEGDTLTLTDRIKHHYTTSLSTIEVAVQERHRILHEFSEYFRRSTVGPAGGYLVRREDQQDQVQALADHLEMLGITYGFVAREGTANGYAYPATVRQKVRIAPGDLMVPAAQPKGVLARVLFEPETELEDSLTYDITAWALPYVYGVEAYILEQDVPWEYSAPRPQYSSHPAAPAAYLAEWKSFEDAQLLASLLQKGVEVRYAELPFRIEGQSYSAGTLIMPRQGRGTAFDSLVIQSAHHMQQQVFGVTTTQVEGWADFGSDDVVMIQAPRIGILSGSSINPYSLGRLWHFFDEQLDYLVTLINGDDFAGVPLSRYDVLILPSGRYGDILDEPRREDVQDWIREGGRLIVLEEAVDFLVGKEGFGLQRKAGIQEPGDSLNLRIYAERERDAMTQKISGALFQVELDGTHPLAFGYSRSYITLKVRNQAYAWLDDGWNVGVIQDRRPVAGFAGAGVRKAMEHSLVIGMESVGRGEIIYFVDDPIYRGFYYHGRLLLANAVFLAGQRSVATY